MSSLIVLDETYAIYTDQLSITMVTHFNLTRKADAHLIDPYALQYVFGANKVFEFDTYPNWLMYPSVGNDYQNVLYRNNMNLFYFYVCSIDYVENDLEFLPQMDLNQRFLSVQNCENRFWRGRNAYVVPAVLGALGAVAAICMIVTLCLWRYNVYRRELSKKKTK
jgi:hypothetical protein